MASPWVNLFDKRNSAMAAYNSLLTPNLSSPGISAAGEVPYGPIASATNRLMTAEAKAPFVANLPDYESMVAKRSANIGSELKGEVPQDVLRQIMQQAAERGVATGSIGSPNSNAAMLRALGLTSLGLQQQGSADLSRSIADTPVPQLFNPASLFVPEHLAGLELSAAQAGIGAGRTAAGPLTTITGAGPGFTPTPRAQPNYANPPAVGAFPENIPTADPYAAWNATYGQYSGTPSWQPPAEEDMSWLDEFWPGSTEPTPTPEASWQDTSWLGDPFADYNFSSPSDPWAMSDFNETDLYGY